MSMESYWRWPLTVPFAAGRGAKGAFDLIALNGF